MTDFLAEKRAEIEQRLEELRPLREEYVRLERAKAALEGAERDAAGAGATGRRRGRGRRAAAGGRGRSAANGRRRRRAGGRAAQALDLVRRNPGITIAEMADRMGMKQRNYLYRVMASLQSEGAVEKQGRGFVAR
jgi:hypothetical protein